MAGIYIHIPFCKSKCSYCDFYSVANSSYISDFVIALHSEIDLKKEALSSQIVDTIYFGGGTPSQLNVQQIKDILQHLFDSYNISKNAEITLEANPDDLTLQYLTLLKTSSINRLSIGLQSLDNDILQVMKRRHSAKEAVESVLLASKLGFSNISIDLIYGIDGLSNASWEQMLNEALSLPVSHLSAYHLGIEEGTLLYRQYKQGKHIKINEDKSFEQYNILVKIARHCGFEQYEISNFAKKQMVSKHNSAYWNEQEYLGLGPSAHSYIDNKRFFNTSNIKQYCSAIDSGESYFEIETLSLNDRINERIMLKLRTTNGLNLRDFKRDFGIKVLNRLNEKITGLNPKYYQINKEQLKLNSSGLFISDSIMAILFE